MKIEQLRILCEVVDQSFSMSRAAAALDMSQPNVSKQIRLLEEQISVELLLRRGGRIIGMTEPGAEVLQVARRIVRDAGNLRSIGEDFRRGDRGRLTIATTHFIARYLLTTCIERFHLQFPRVQITLHETSQRHALEMLQSTEADLGILSDPPKGGAGGIVQPADRLRRQWFRQQRQCASVSHTSGRVSTTSSWPSATADRSRRRRAPTASNRWR